MSDSSLHAPAADALLAAAGEIAAAGGSPSGEVDRLIDGLLLQAGSAEFDDVAAVQILTCAAALSPSGEPLAAMGVDLTDAGFALDFGADRRVEFADRRLAIAFINGVRAYDVGVVDGEPPVVLRKDGASICTDDGAVLAAGLTLWTVCSEEACEVELESYGTEAGAEAFRDGVHLGRRWL